MDRETFKRNLYKATMAGLDFMRSLVTNPLPNNYRYLVLLSKEYYFELLEQHKPIPGVPFPHMDAIDKARDSPERLRAVEEQDIVDLFWNEDEIPKWVNMEVQTYDAQHTYFQLELGGPVPNTDTEVYHVDEGYPPFHVLSGPLPQGWRSLEKDGKFDLRDRRR